jgi:hypothetical protein
MIVGNLCAAYNSCRFVRGNSIVFESGVAGGSSGFHTLYKLETRDVPLTLVVHHKNVVYFFFNLSNDIDNGKKCSNSF